MPAPNRPLYSTVGKAVARRAAPMAADSVVPGAGMLFERAPSLAIRAANGLSLAAYPVATAQPQQDMTDPDGYYRAQAQMQQQRDLQGLLAPAPERMARQAVQSVVGALMGRSTDGNPYYSPDWIDQSRASAQTGYAGPSRFEAGMIPQQQLPPLQQAVIQARQPRPNPQRVPITNPATGLTLMAEPRAAGGRIDPNQPYLVGEQGPELVIPKQAGTVIPAAQTRQALGGSGLGGGGGIAPQSSTYQRNSGLGAPVTFGGTLPALQQSSAALNTSLVAPVTFAGHSTAQQSYDHRLQSPANPRPSDAEVAQIGHDIDALTRANQQPTTYADYQRQRRGNELQSLAQRQARSEAVKQNLLLIEEEARAVERAMSQQAGASQAPTESGGLSDWIAQRRAGADDRRAARREWVQGITPYGIGEGAREFIGNAIGKTVDSARYYGGLSDQYLVRPIESIGRGLFGMDPRQPAPSASPAGLAPAASATATSAPNSTPAPAPQQNSAPATPPASTMYTGPSRFEPGMLSPRTDSPAPGLAAQSASTGPSTRYRSPLQVPEPEMLRGSGIGVVYNRDDNTTTYSTPQGTATFQGKRKGGGGLSYGQGMGSEGYASDLRQLAQIRADRQAEADARYRRGLENTILNPPGDATPHLSNGSAASRLQSALINAPARREWEKRAAAAQGLLNSMDAREQSQATREQTQADKLLARKAATAEAQREQANADRTFAAGREDALINQQNAQFNQANAERGRLLDVERLRIDQQRAADEQAREAAKNTYTGQIDGYMKILAQNAMPGTSPEDMRAQAEGMVRQNWLASGNAFTPDRTGPDGATIAGRPVTLAEMRHSADALSKQTGMQFGVDDIRRLTLSPNPQAELQRILAERTKAK